MAIYEERHMNMKQNMKGVDLGGEMRKGKESLKWHKVWNCFWLTQGSKLGQNI